MKSNISKSVKYLIGLCVAGLCACGIYVSLAYANVCFLPSGLCDFSESQHQDDFVYTTPGGDCTGDIEHDKSMCCLLSPLPHFKCEQCDNGRFKCEEECINNDYQLINNRGTRQSECVCKGDACGSIPTSTNNKDLRDQHCSVSLNSCGLCPENKCVCNGEKCSARNTGGKKYECSTSKTNVCGNCPTDRNATCECVNCCDVFGNDWYSDSDRKCKYVNHTKDNTACYKPYPCPCTEEFPGTQAGDNCLGDQYADFVGTAENGEACYKCRTKTCAHYSDQNVTYHDTYSDRNERCQGYQVATFNGKTCYIHTNLSCETLFSGYSGASIFLSDGNLRESYSDCYSFTEKNDCNDYTGTCYLGSKKTCTDRGLLPVQPNGQICDAISACDMTCFDLSTCRTPGLGCIENGGQFEANRNQLPCEEICQYTTTYPKDEGKTCYLCEAGCDPCKKINSAYRSSPTDPCEGGTCCQNGGWWPVPKANAKHTTYYPNGKEGCYKCTACNQIDSNLSVGAPAGCITPAQHVTMWQNVSLNNCYKCRTCYNYGIDLGAYTNNAIQNTYPAYQENQCASDKIQIEVPETNKCYRCPSCNQYNSSWISGSTCSDTTKVAKPVIDYPQCKKCVKCPDSTWSTTRPTGCGDVATQKDDDTGYTCYKCRDVTCANYSELPNPDSCTAECYGPKEQNHDGLICYTCDQPRSCEEVLGSKPEYNNYTIHDQDQNSLECQKVQSCGKDCWACQTCERKNPDWHTGSKPSLCTSGADEKVADTKNCYQCTESSHYNCPISIQNLIVVGYSNNQTLLAEVTMEYDVPEKTCKEGLSEDQLEIIEDYEFDPDSPPIKMTFSFTTEDGQVCPYRYCRLPAVPCEHWGLYDGEYIKAHDPCADEGKQTYKHPTKRYYEDYNINSSTPCYGCVSCSEINSSYHDAIYLGVEEQTVGTETRQIMKYNYTCTDNGGNTYQGTPVNVGHEYSGAVCYRCQPTCSDKGYLEVDGQCPDNKPSGEITWIDNEVGECLTCTDCPKSLSRFGSFMDNELYQEQCIGGFGSSLLNSYNQSTDKETFIKQYNQTHPTDQINEDNIDLFLDCAEAAGNHDQECCLTCRDIDGTKRCKKQASKTIGCTENCSKYGYLDVCPPGMDPLTRWVEKLNRDCIYACKDGNTSSSGGGGGGGGGSGSDDDGYYHVSDSASDVMACASCCTKEVSSGGEKLVVKSGAPGSCQPICNEARCCYKTPGNEHDDETSHLLCSFESMVSSGTCDPSKQADYFQCPNGFTCQWEFGKPSWQGRCIAYGGSADDMYPNQDYTSVTCSPGCSGSTPFCCVTSVHNASTNTDHLIGKCVEDYNHCSFSGTGSTGTGYGTSMQDGSYMGNGNFNVYKLCECLYLYTTGTMTTNSDCTGYLNDFQQDYDRWASQCNSILSH